MQPRVLELASRRSAAMKAVQTMGTMPRARHILRVCPIPLNLACYMNPANGKLRKPAPNPQQRTRVPSIHWLFRSNIPRRRASYITPDVQKRNFFGMGEIIGVLTNPAETVRSLTESKKLLDEARREIVENRERSQLRTKHTFSRLPGFFPRKAEMQAIERAMEGEPSFTVLFGASSVGKTALLREVLSREEYHVLHFDLRIAGFADLASLYMSLSQQMEQYFEEIASKMEGYADFEKEAWSFKHDRLTVQRRMSEGTGDLKQQQIKTSDVARLMELFQSSLLKYWEFEPVLEDKQEESSKSGKGSDSKRKASSESSRTLKAEDSSSPAPRSRWGFRSWGRSKGKEPERKERVQEKQKEVIEKEKPTKKMPVIFFDEAHKLPALIQSTDTMKCLLDSMLVLTKQDRLCHVIHATSDPFYQTWLRQLNVMQHCKIITIGDCSKAETRKFYKERIIPRVPERIRGGLNFEVLYEAFGGKLAHWHDYITDYVNSNGTLDIKQSSHFLQAHALLNLHIIHSSQALSGGPEGAEASGSGAAGGVGANGNANTSTADTRTLHPGLGPAGFKIYSPLTYPFNPMAMGMGGGGGTDGGSSMHGGGFGGGSSMGIGGPPEFSAMQLLKVMSRLANADGTTTAYIPYFHLCRELGVRAVDGMVKGRVLDLRWTECVGGVGFGGALGAGVGAGLVPGHTRDSTVVGPGPGPGHTSVLDPPDSAIGPPPPIDADMDEEDMVPVSEADMGMGMGGSSSSRAGALHGGAADMYYDEVMEVVGPKLVPTTPIMRYAMRDVVAEYEDDQSVSEYASLSDVDEY